MRHLIVAALLSSAAVVATPASAAVINLSATDFAASSSVQTFAAGTYQISLVQGTYNAWAPATPSAGNWVDYYKYTINGVVNYFNPLNSQRFGTAAAAFTAYSTQPQLQLSFATTTQVNFAIADDQASFNDNAGGVSLNITAVPEPATWAMMIAGFGIAGVAMRRRQRPVAVAA